MHRDTSDRLHEMIIVHAADTYVRPHKHLNKTESFHVIEGKLSVVIFEDGGELKKVIPMSAYGNGTTFYYRLNESLFHTVIPISEWVVFHEVVNGPFDKGDTSFAAWAPFEQDRGGVNKYLQALAEQLHNAGN